MVEIRNKEQYFDLLKEFDYIPYTQTESWYKLYSARKPIHTRFFVDNLEQPEIAFFGYQKRFLGFKMFFIEGESFKHLPVDGKKLKSLFEDLQSVGFDVIEMDSSLPYDPQYEIGMRRAGFLRPVGLFSSSFSSLVNTNAPNDFDRNWKQNLKKAEKVNLRYEFSETIDKDQITEFYAMYQEMLDRKRVSDSTKFVQFLELIDQPGFGFCSVKNDEDKIICAVIFYHYNGEGVDLYRVTSLEARSNGASFFIYKHLFSSLAEFGLSSYDMGRLTPSIHSKDAIFTFKSGAGGVFIIYNGEWAWYKRPLYRPLMYLVKRFLMKRIEV
ncbi:MAG: GNAT family N-acetyltransferase [Bacteroidales bacterium]|nr:GNAT family N-acetyltransferase [Bacteroidales bacterium]